MLLEQPLSICAETPFMFLSDVLRNHAAFRADKVALLDPTEQLTYGQLEQTLDHIAYTLQQAGLSEGDSVAICASNSVKYAALFMGVIRAGMVVAPLAPSSTAQSLLGMLSDCNAKLFFVDQAVHSALNEVAEQLQMPVVLLDQQGFTNWLQQGTPRPAVLEPEAPFNVIYSSGTTGEPKGIVQSHAMRWLHVSRGTVLGYGPECVTLLSTPLYSNTTLVAFLPTLALGGKVVLMPKFDATGYLHLAQTHRVTHTMLVPVQYQRLMAHPEFDQFDLSSFVMKLSTSAPFHAELKADILARWPGGLVEFYGMTEGGGSCMLLAHEHPDKLATVGRPLEGQDMRVIDEQGNELPQGAIGEVVGHSGAMMTAYLNKPEKTKEAEWYDATGKRFIRTGDVGRFDEDGFLTLMDRRKDMIISGGFNIYPSDLETELRLHPQLAEVTVIGVPSTSWGETPVAYVVPKANTSIDATEVLNWFNQRVGKTQRLNRVLLSQELPRSAIGKVLKRELRDQFHNEFGTLA